MKKLNLMVSLAFVISTAIAFAAFASEKSKEPEKTKHTACVKVLINKPLVLDYGVVINGVCVVSSDVRPAI